MSSIRLEDRANELVPARPRSAGEDFFRVAGIELLSGQPFGPEDGSEEISTIQLLVRTSIALVFAAS